MTVYQHIRNNISPSAAEQRFKKSCGVDCRRFSPFACFFDFGFHMAIYIQSTLVKRRALLKFTKPSAVQEMVNILSKVLWIGKGMGTLSTGHGSNKCGPHILGTDRMKLK